MEIICFVNEIKYFIVWKGILKALISATLGSTRGILRIEHESISTKFSGGWSEPFTNYHTGDLDESSYPREFINGYKRSMELNRLSKNG